MSGPVNPVFYRFFVKANAFQASSLHRLRAMRPQVPDEQHSARKRQTRLGQGMHPLHGLWSAIARQKPLNMGKKSFGNRAISLKSCR